MNDIRCSFSGANMARLEFIFTNFTASCFPAFSANRKIFWRLFGLHEQNSVFRLTAMAWGVYFEHLL